MVLFFVISSTRKYFKEKEIKKEVLDFLSKTDFPFSVQGIADNIKRERKDVFTVCRRLEKERKIDALHYFSGKKRI
jgi:hypothetical protein